MAHEVDQALRRAATLARNAPSIHHNRPWRWRSGPGALELWADRARQLRARDPEGRMLTISCGAALHRALVTLAAQGHHTTVVPLPDPARPDLLARVTVTGTVPIRAYGAIALPHTRRPPLDVIADAARPSGAFLRYLPADRVAKLGELAARAGITGLPVGGPSYGVLYGEEDDPAAWLRAGQALSAIWDAATELAVSVVPITAVIEVPATRRALRELLYTTSWPYLVLRLTLTARSPRARRVVTG
jgi:hypothetical protein